MRRRHPDASPAVIMEDIRAVKECLIIARRRARHTPLLKKKILSALKSCDGAVRHLKSYAAPAELATRATWQQ